MSEQFNERERQASSSLRDTASGKATRKFKALTPGRAKELSESRSISLGTLMKESGRFTHRPPRPRLDEMTAPRQTERAESMYPKLKSSFGSRVNYFVADSFNAEFCSVLTSSCHSVVVVRRRGGSKLERNGRDARARLPGGRSVSPTSLLV